jgi:hypothetical protein
MRTASVELLSITLACVLGCASSKDGPGGSDRGGSGALGGSAPSSGGTVSQSGAGTVSGGTDSGGLPSGGSSAGSPSGNSGGSSGLAGGGSGGRANSGAGGQTSGAGGRANGSGGRASGGAGGGSGGAGACVQNLACKLSPPPSTGDIYQDCVDRINQFLTQCACLPALTRRTDGEACADQMAEYDASKNSAHAGAKDKICMPSGSQNECPGYSSNSQVIGLCMQQMWDEGPPPTDPCSGSCYEMYGHYINMTDKSVTKVACGFYTTSAGKVWAVQNFSH